VRFTIRRLMAVVALSALVLGLANLLADVTDPAAAVVALLSLTPIFGPFVWLAYKAVGIFFPR
jgi:hypothetical protein